MGNVESVDNKIQHTGQFTRSNQADCMSLDCESKPTQTQGEHANSTRKGPWSASQVLNPGVSCCEATARPTAPWWVQMCDKAQGISVY